MERILVVDDDAAIRESLLSYFEDRGLEAVAAASVEEAFDTLSHCPCDLAIVDLRLPGKTGEDYILEAHQLYPRLGFIIHTGSADYQITPQLRALGVREKDVHIKPVLDLKQLVDHVMELRALLRQRDHGTD